MRFVAPLTFQSLSRRRVYTSLWESTEDFRSQHLSLSELAELMIVAPATADILSRFAAGLGGDLVSTLALSITGACPMLVAPAMNTRMWQSPAVQANMDTLRGRGVHVAGPADGRLACGTTGPGRMAEPSEIIDAARRILAGSPGT